MTGAARGTNYDRKCETEKWEEHGNLAIHSSACILSVHNISVSRGLAPR